MFVEMFSRRRGVRFYAAVTRGIHADISGAIAYDESSRGLPKSSATGKLFFSSYLNARGHHFIDATFSFPMMAICRGPAAEIKTMRLNDHATTRHAASHHLMPGFHINILPRFRHEMKTKLDASCDAFMASFTQQHARLAVGVRFAE